jgi:superfamily II DNA or RNA helicase
MRLMAAFGPVGMVVSEKTLIDRGILATPYFKVVTGLTPPAKLHRYTGWQAAYRIGITQNFERNKHIVRETLRASKYGLTSMVLIQHREHGELLERMMTAVKMRAKFIHGDSSQPERMKALNALESGKLDVVIGSTILDVGVDVPAVGMIVLGGGGKAEVGLRQRIGRGLREKKNGMPNVALIVDFADERNTHLRTHALTRQQIIANTDGFRERMLPPGGDFDFAALGLTARKVA